MKPLILIDVDGVLNPTFSAKTRRHLQFHEGWISRRIELPWATGRLFVNPLHGKWLRDLAEETDAELAWGTGWEEYANYHVSPLLMLPELPVAPAPTGRKPEKVIPWTAGRPFVWFEDEPAQVASAQALAEAAGQPHKVIWVSEHTGLTQGHIALARDWLLSF